MWHTFPAKAYPALAHTPPRFFVMTKKFLVMTKNIQIDGDMGSPRIGRASPCWARVTFKWPLPSGVVPLFVQYKPFTCRSARRPLRPAGVVEKGGFAAAAFGGRDARLGISRHRCQEFRHDEIFEIGTQTSSAALGHCQSLVVVVIVLLRLLLPMQGDGDTAMTWPSCRRHQCPAMVTGPRDRGRSTVTQKKTPPRRGRGADRGTYRRRSASRT